MWKITFGLLLLSVMLSAFCIGHAMGTGVAIPYPDPTPEQAAYEKYHLKINGTLFKVAACSWLTAGAVFVIDVACLMRRGTGR